MQHIALATADIVASVRAMAANDVSFLKVPPAYYELLPDRIGIIKEDIHVLAELGILVDRDDEGYLLQIFTKPRRWTGRPCFSRSSSGTGHAASAAGNFKAALFAERSRWNRRAGGRFDGADRQNAETSPMRHPLPPVASIRDFYAFEQHVATCRRQRGLDMVPQWYQVPVFYFSNPAGVIHHDSEVWAPAGSQTLDFELELACIIGREARDLPDDDRALRCRRRLHDHERLDAARDLLAVSRWPSAWGPAKGKTSRHRSVPSW